ncbi:DMT family transporter [bacterium]|nr:MAG: DMT family transporter [bacterium]
MNFVLLAVAVLCMSQPANLIRWAHAPIEVIGFWRLAIATLALAPFAWRARASWLALQTRQRGLHLAAGVFLFVHLWTYVYAAQHTLIANCMAAFCTHPLLVGLGAWIFHGEKPTARLGVSYLLAGLGVWALLSGSMSLDPARLAGDLAGIASAGFYAGYVLLGRSLRKSLDNRAYATGVYAVTAALFFVTGVARGVAWDGQPPVFWLSVAGLGLGVTLGGHAMFSYLLGSMNVNVMTTAKLLEPIFGGLTAWLAFGEPLRARTGLAFALIAGAVVVLVTDPRHPGPMPEED